MDQSQLIAQRIHAVRAGRTTRLDLSDLQLTQIPASVFSLTSLTELTIKNQAPLSETLGVQMMDWAVEKAFNPASAIEQDDALSPAELKKLLGHIRQDTQLPAFQIRILPEAIGQLVNLEILDLSYQAIAQLPDAFAGLSRLRQLRLPGNEIKRLPAGFVRLICLEVADLQKNPIRKWPEGLASMPLLQVYEARRVEARQRKDNFVQGRLYEEAAEARQEEMRWGLHH